jgi:hypothetical protein
MLSEELDELLPLAGAWIDEAEAQWAGAGTPLGEVGRAVARQAGVREIDRVRVRRVPTMPEPSHPRLRRAMVESGFLLHTAHGLALDHAIALREDAPTDIALLAHELKHVEQYERLGREGFLRLYITECLSFGYAHSPLEREARRFQALFQPPKPPAQ